MSTASFYSALKANHLETVEGETQKLAQVYEAIFGDTTRSREELLEEVAKVGVQAVRVVKITVEFEDDVVDITAPAGEVIN